MSRILLVALATTLIPVKVLAMEAPKSANPILDAMRRNVINHRNIEPDIVNLLNRYQTDEQLKAALLPLSKLPGADQHFNVNDLDALEKLEQTAVDAQINERLRPLNDALGGSSWNPLQWAKKALVKNMLVNHLESGLKQSAPDTTAAQAAFEQAQRQAQEAQAQEAEAVQAAQAAQAEEADLAAQIAAEEQAIAQLEAAERAQAEAARAADAQRAQAFIAEAQARLTRANQQRVDFEAQERAYEEQQRARAEAARLAELEIAEPNDNNADVAPADPENLENQNELEEHAEQARAAQDLAEREAVRLVAEREREVVRLAAEREQEAARIVVEQQQAAQEAERAHAQQAEAARVTAEQQVAQQAAARAERMAALRAQQAAARERTQQAEADRVAAAQNAQRAQAQVPPILRPEVPVNPAAAQGAPDANGAMGWIGTLMNLWNTIKGKATEHPVAAAAIGIGAALVLGKLISWFMGGDDEDEDDAAPQPDGARAPQDEPKNEQPAPQGNRPEKPVQSTSKTVSEDEAKEARNLAAKRKRAQLRRAFFKNRGRCCKSRCKRSCR